MRRLSILIPVALAGCLALASCSGGSPGGQAAGKSGQGASSAQSTHRTSSEEDTPPQAPKPATVVDGMHYVQLFNTVDPVLAELAHDAIGDTLPARAHLQSAATSLRQFAAQARTLPSAGSDRHTLNQLAAASSTLAGQLDALAAKGSQSSNASTFTAALSSFQSAAAAARHAAGLPPVVTSSKPQPDTGP
jgi:hypothetical protein